MSSDSTDKLQHIPQNSDARRLGEGDVSSGANALAARSSGSTDKLQRILQTFDARRLGEGDVSAGANVLAAMACAIANVRRHGVRIASGDGPPVRIGCSVLACGPLTSALIGDRVESALAEYQSHLDSHCNEWELAKEVYFGGPDGRAPDDRFAVEMDVKSLRVLSDCMTKTVGDSLAALLEPLPNRMKRALLERPLIFASGAQPKQLGAALERSHAGQLLVHEVLRTPAQCALLADCCLPLIDGCLTVGKQANPVRGHLLLRDPSLVLDEVLRDGGHATRLLVRLPWLVDGNAGPAMTLPDDSATRHPRLNAMELRFRMALVRAWIGRLDYSANEPGKLDLDISSYQSRWIAFLQQKEAEFPGISATARPLMATLLFGLRQMVLNPPRPEGVELYAEDVEALARILVQRMCNARAVMLHDTAKQDRERKLQAMFEKLSAGPASVRDLTRKHHRLSTNEARDLLSELVTRGQAVELGADIYQPATTGSQHKAPTLTLEA